MTTEDDITIKRYRSARSLKLRLLPSGKIVVTAPTLLSERRIWDFIEEHQSWIEEKSRLTRENRESLTNNKDTLLFRGKSFDFRISVSAQKKPGIELGDAAIVLTSPSENHQQVRTILEKWYRLQAKKRFAERVPLLADLMGYQVMTVSVRDQRSRWGSCSSRSNISLNWRLIQAPDWVSDYVIYHELTHLKHMNHSKSFWNSLAELVPEYKKAERWLKDNHKLLNF